MSRTKESKGIRRDETHLEERLETLERAVAELQNQLASALASGNWIAGIAGSISDEPAFLEALEFGRAFRQADRPSDDPPAQP